jgi:negative regulator of sigma-B (phosphoserine phosphatase)
MGSLIEWGVAAHTLAGEQESGDLSVVEWFPDGVLVAVIDALGHGQEAAVAARVAGATLHAHASEPVATLVRRCHEQLRFTRGVVMTVASFDARAGTMIWLGIGNVDGYLVRADSPDGTTKRRREAIVTRGGVVGFQLPTTNAVSLPLTPGDMLILATDGITSGFIGGHRRGTPQEIADDILAQYGKTTDDALVFVARYHGAGR